MTIKLLTPRDIDGVSYPANALVSLSSATESGLVASKEATTTLTGGIVYTPPVPSGQPENLKVLRNSAQGIIFQRKTTGMRKHLGRFKSSTATVDDGYTHQQISEIPVGADAVQVRYYNNEAATVTVGRSLVAPTSKPALEAVYNAAGTADTSLWKNAQFSGANSVTLPARVAANIPSITESDIIPLRTIDRADGGTYPAVALRCYIATGPYSISQIDQTPFATTPGLKTWCRRKSGDFANSNYAGFATTETPSAGGWYAELVFFARGQVLSIMAVGDSTMEGLYSGTGVGYAEKVCATLLAEGLPVSMVNQGWHAQASADTFTRMKALLELGTLPDLIVYSPYTINSISTVVTDAIIDADLARAHQVAALCRKKRVGLVFVNGLPCDPSFKDLNASDALRVTLNTRLAALGAAVGVPVADIATPVSGVTDADGQVNMLAGTHVGDGVHLSDTGNALVHDALLPIVRAELLASTTRQQL
jgi:lysophospholipase L1-like esterase